MEFNTLYDTLYTLAGIFCLFVLNEWLDWLKNVVISNREVGTIAKVKMYTKQY